MEMGEKEDRCVPVFLSASFSHTSDGSQMFRPLTKKTHLLQHL